MSNDNTNDTNEREDTPMEPTPTPPITLTAEELARLRTEDDRNPVPEAERIKARWQATMGGTGPVVIDGADIDEAIRRHTSEGPTDGAGVKFDEGGWTNPRAHLPRHEPTPSSIPAEDWLRAIIADPPDPFDDRQVILVIDGGHLNAFIRWAGDWYSFDTPLKHPDMSWSSTLAVLRSSRGEIVVPAPGIVMQAPNRDA